MDKTISATIVGALTGGSMIAGSPTLTIEQASSLVVSCVIILLWLNTQFNSIRKEQAREHEKNRVSRVWFVASINLINQHLRLKSLPMPNDEQTTTTT